MEIILSICNRRAWCSGSKSICIVGTDVGASAPLVRATIGLVGTAALGCPAEHSSAIFRFRQEHCRAALDRADEGVHPYVVRDNPRTSVGARAYMSLMWVAMYHLLPKGSVTPPLRSP